MTATWTDEQRSLRNWALLRAEDERKDATHEVEVEYSETVSKLRERFEYDLEEANRLRLARLTPAHQAYNRAVVAAEHGPR